VTPKGGKEVYQTTGVPFIRSQNVLKGTLDLSDVAYIPSETDAAMKRTRIFGGETLFNITGASIGRACFVPFSQTIGNVNQHVCILRYRNYVVPELPQFWLNSPAVQDFVVGNQIGQTRQALNFKQIRGMYYPLAPIAEQSEIVRILDSLFAKEQQAKEAAEAVLEKIDLLKKSILARAFRGELGTNDPNEESAVELLKQIAQ
jgi:type I restriction enzyme S subunit